MENTNSKAMMKSYVDTGFISGGKWFKNRKHFDDFNEFEKNSVKSMRVKRENREDYRDIYQFHYDQLLIVYNKEGKKCVGSIRKINKKSVSVEMFDIVYDAPFSTDKNDEGNIFYYWYRLKKQDDKEKRPMKVIHFRKAQAGIFSSLNKVRYFATKTPLDNIYIPPYSR
jgi:hypothetical protein